MAKGGLLSPVLTGMHLPDLESLLLTFCPPLRITHLLCLLLTKKNIRTERRDFCGSQADKSLPVQGTRVRSLVGEDSICRRATKPVHHSYCVRAPQRRAPALSN